MNDLLNDLGRKKILDSDDFNLSVDRYKEGKDYSDTKWPMVELGEIAEILNVTPKTVENHIALALKYISKALESYKKEGVLNSI